MMSVEALNVAILTAAGMTAATINQCGDAVITLRPGHLPIIEAELVPMPPSLDADGDLYTVKAIGTPTLTTIMIPQAPDGHTSRVAKHRRSKR